MNDVLVREPLAQQVKQQVTCVGGQFVAVVQQLHLVESRVAADDRKDQLVIISHLDVRVKVCNGMGFRMNKGSRARVIPPTPGPAHRTREG